ncbi:hypothetical protein DIPPA_28903 [Diplonema papillatum]|nr:hypothetical protein DIPPA_28903 [Diplonema papillatum]|eukprot:gene4298-6644_t
MRQQVGLLAGGGGVRAVCLVLCVQCAGAAGEEGREPTCTEPGAQHAAGVFSLALAGVAGPYEITLAVAHSVTVTCVRWNAPRGKEACAVQETQLCRLALTSARRSAADFCTLLTPEMLPLTATAPTDASVVWYLQYRSRAPVPSGCYPLTYAAAAAFEAESPGITSNDYLFYVVVSICAIVACALVLTLAARCAKRVRAAVVRAEKAGDGHPRKRSRGGGSSTRSPGSAPKHSPRECPAFSYVGGTSPAQSPLATARDDPARGCAGYNGVWLEGAAYPCQPPQIRRPPPLGPPPGVYSVCGGDVIPVGAWSQPCRLVQFSDLSTASPGSAAKPESAASAARGGGGGSPAKGGCGDWNVDRPEPKAVGIFDPAAVVISLEGPPSSSGSPEAHVDLPETPVVSAPRISHVHVTTDGLSFTRSFDGYPVHRVFLALSSPQRMDGHYVVLDEAPAELTQLNNDPHPLTAADNKAGPVFISWTSVKSLPSA